ncbi:hypothetical protein PG985_016292 [Apiospora marii]|uniref:uncharacterized protein n=1 Tax=Apiospora marii TaxID=335849 RepID=UPI00312DF155
MTSTPGPDDMNVDNRSDSPVGVSADEMSGLSLRPYNTSNMIDYNAQRSDNGSKASPGSPVGATADEMSGLSLEPYNTSSMIDYNAAQGSEKGGSQTSDVAWDRLQDVKTYFTNAGLKFRRPIAVGNHGGTVLFDKFDQDEDGGEVLAKSLVVKYALDTEEDASTSNDADLENEMGWLRKMHYAEHIIQTDPAYWSLWDDDKDNAGAGQLLKKPVIVMEYLEHGTLEQLIKRFKFVDLRIPDRMIWYFALCLVRACTAMGYRDQFVGVDKTKREHVSKTPGAAGPPPPSGLAQDSMKGANVLIGQLIPGDKEHEITPLLKLIDFGRGVEYKADDPANADFKENTGLTHNLDGVGFVSFSFLFFICRRTPEGHPSTNKRGGKKILTDMIQRGAEYYTGTTRWKTEPNAIFNSMDFETDADRKLLENPLVDRQLRDMIAYFRARSAWAFPDLVEARSMCIAGIRASMKSTNPIDSDASLRLLVQRLVFNADEEAMIFDYLFEDETLEQEDQRRAQEEIDRGERV